MGARMPGEQWVSISPHCPSRDHSTLSPGHTHPNNPQGREDSDEKPCAESPSPKFDSDKRLKNSHPQHYYQHHRNSLKALPHPHKEQSFSFLFKKREVALICMGTSNVRAWTRAEEVCKLSSTRPQGHHPARAMSHGAGSKIPMPSCKTLH